MTAECMAKGVGGALASFKRLREQWLLIVALVSALFWARDLVMVYARLPEDVARHAVAVDQLERRVAGLEAGHLSLQAGGPPPEGPGLLSGPPGGRHDQWTELHWRSDAAGDPTCRLMEIGAVLVGPTGQWHRMPARTVPQSRPQTPSRARRETGSLALGVKPHARMGVGRARLRLQLVHDCNGRLQTERAPWRPFTLRAG